MKRLQVYLSSTFEDLKDHRRAVVDALDKAGLLVARMEAYTAADERPVARCLRDVADSDVYVGVFAWRYGYVPPVDHDNPSGRSITELEYRHAEQRKLRKLLFFAHADTKANWPAAFIDEVTGDADRGEKMIRLRRELCTENTAAFFRTPDDLATLVLAAIFHPGLGGKRFVVPPRPKGLVSRPGLTSALLAALCGNGRPVGANSVVVGAGGFGKTTLAIEVCHHARTLNEFPDGVFWVALGERPDVTRILAELHNSVTGSPPAVASPDAVARSVENALAGHRCLLVIDDVWRAHDLTSFLGLAGPRLLVTTRVRHLVEQLGQTGWAEVLVDEMESAEAATLLERGISADDSKRQMLEAFATRLGCWPLLLDLANARLLEEQNARRGDARHAIESVISLFERRGVLVFDQREPGFDRVNPNARNRAVALSVDVALEFADSQFPGLVNRAAELAVFPEDVPIPLHVLEDLWDADGLAVEEETVRPLDRLSVLRWDRDGGDVRLHDMIRRALEARLDEPQVVHRRLLDSWGDATALPYEYAWRWFAWHCMGANEQHRLHRVVRDIDWLCAKLDATDINALIGDLEQLRGDAQPGVLLDCLRASGHVLATDKSRLLQQLLARMPEDEQPLRNRILDKAAACETPWLRPLRASLRSTSQLLRTFVGHTHFVESVALTPDGKRAVSASADQTLRIWDLATGEVLHTLHGHTGHVRVVRLTASGMRAVSASHDATVRVWDVEKGELLATLRGHRAMLYALAVTPDGRTAVSGSSGGLLKVWDLETSREEFSLEGPINGVTGVAVTHDGRRAAVTSYDGTLKVWDLEGRKLFRTIDASQGFSVKAIALTTDGSRALSGGDDGTLKVWDLETGVLLQTLTGHTQWVNAVALTPDGRRAVSASLDSTIRIWDVERGTLLTTLRGHVGPVNGIAVALDGLRLLSGGDDRTLKLWNIGDTHGLLESDGIGVHSGGVNAIVLTPDGTRAVSVCRRGTLKVWDCDRGAVLQTIAGRDEIEAVAVSPDGRWAVTAGDDADDPSLQVWDLEGGAALQRLSGHTGRVTAICITPDGKRIVSASGDRTLRVWTLGRRTALRRLKGHLGRITAVAALRDGRHVISASRDGTLKVWNLQRGTVAGSVDAHVKKEGVAGVAVTSDRRRAVSYGKDKWVRVWNLEEGRAQLITEREGGQRPIAVMADGTHHVLSDYDHNLLIHNFDADHVIATFTADSSILAAAVLPDDRTIIAGDMEGRVHFLRLEGV